MNPPGTPTPEQLTEQNEHLQKSLQLFAESAANSLASVTRQLMLEKGQAETALAHANARLNDALKKCELLEATIAELSKKEGDEKPQPTNGDGNSALDTSKRTPRSRQPKSAGS